MRLTAHRCGRRSPGVGDDDAAGRLEPLVAGIVRVIKRRPAHFVIGEHGREHVGRRRAHAVELRERAVRVTEEAQHRDHAIDGGRKDRGRGHVPRLENLPQWQQINQDFDQCPGIAADMPAVWKNLPAQLVDQALCRLPQQALFARHAKARESQRDRDQQTRIAVLDRRVYAAEKPHLPGEATHIGAVESVIGILQNQRRMCEPGDHAARDDLGTPRIRVRAAMLRNPVGDERARSSAKA